MFIGRLLIDCAEIAGKKKLAGGGEDLQDRTQTFRGVAVIKSPVKRGCI